jgi:DNA-binding IclR family transcriptional regulator
MFLRCGMQYRSLAATDFACPIRFVQFPTERVEEMPKATAIKKTPAVTLSLLKALDILECLHTDGPSLSPAEIASKIGISRPTTYRLLSTMALRGWVSKDPQTEGNYRLGYHVLTIAGTMLQRIDLRTLARPYMEELFTNYQESVSLFLLDGGEAVHLDRVNGSRPVQAFMPLGGRGCLHSKAVGKAILASLDEPEIDRIIRECGLAKVTPHTITNPKRLKQELAQTRACGYGISNEEDVEGLRAVGAAVLDMEGRPIGGLAISGLVMHMDDARVKLLGEAIAASAHHISAALGHLKQTM